MHTPKCAPPPPQTPHSLPRRHQRQRSLPPLPRGRSPSHNPHWPWTRGSSQTTPQFSEETRKLSHPMKKSYKSTSPAAPWGSQTLPPSKSSPRYVHASLWSALYDVYYHLSFHTSHYLPSHHTHTTSLHHTLTHLTTPTYTTPSTPSHGSPLRPTSLSLASPPSRYIVPKATSNGCTRCFWTPPPRGRCLPSSRQSHWTPPCQSSRGSFPG